MKMPERIGALEKVREKVYGNSTVHFYRSTAPTVS